MIATPRLSPRTSARPSSWYVPIPDAEKAPGVPADPVRRRWGAA